MQIGEDVDRNNVLQANYTNEAPWYTGANSNEKPNFTDVFDHEYFRRGVRLIFGSSLPGIYDMTTPANTRGFTVASENGVYVQGNYNATGIVSPGTPPPAGNAVFPVRSDHRISADKRLRGWKFENG